MVRCEVEKYDYIMVNKCWIKWEDWFDLIKNNYCSKLKIKIMLNYFLNWVQWINVGFTLVLCNPPCCLPPFLCHSASPACLFETRFFFNFTLINFLNIISTKFTWKSRKMKAFCEIFRDSWKSYWSAYHPSCRGDRRLDCAPWTQTDYLHSSRVLFLTIW